jgi:hypothetical protein
MHEWPLQKTADALHALLSMVPNQSEKAVEARRQPAQLPPLQMGHREGVLELLRLVQIAGTAQVTREPLHPPYDHRDFA